MEPTGTHILYTVKSNHLNSIEKIHYTFDKICNDLGFTILNRCHHQFTPQGITSIYLLSESHISIHTWPEKTAGFIDVFCCRELDTHSIDKIRDVIVECLDVASIDELIIYRKT